MLHHQVVEKGTKQILKDLKVKSKFLDFLQQLDCITWDTWFERMEVLEEQKFEILIETKNFIKGKL